MVKYTYMSNLERFEIIPNNEVTTKVDQVFTVGPVYDELKEKYLSQLRYFLHPEFGGKLIFVTNKYMLESIYGHESARADPNTLGTYDFYEMFPGSSYGRPLSHDVRRAITKHITDVFQIVRFDYRITHKELVPVYAIIKYTRDAISDIDISQAGIYLYNKSKECLQLSEARLSYDYDYIVRYNVKDFTPLEDCFMPAQEEIMELALKVECSYDIFKNYLYNLYFMLSDKMIVTEKRMSFIKLDSKLLIDNNTRTVYSSSEFADKLIPRDYRVNDRSSLLFEFIEKNYIALCDSFFGPQSTIVKLEVIERIKENIKDIKHENRLK